MKQSFLFFPSIQKDFNIIFLVKKSSAEQKQTNKQTDKQELPESSLKTFLKIKGGGEKKKKKSKIAIKKKKKKPPWSTGAQKQKTVGYGTPQWLYVWHRFTAVNSK